MKTPLLYGIYRNNLLRANVEYQLGVSYGYKFRFRNGFGLSVIKGPGSIGYRQDLWETAVLYFGKGNESYTVLPHTEVGRLTDKQVLAYLSKIQELRPPRDLHAL